MRTASRECSSKTSSPTGWSVLLGRGPGRYQGERRRGGGGNETRSCESYHGVSWTPLMFILPDGDSDSSGTPTRASSPRVLLAIPPALPAHQSTTRVGGGRDKGRDKTETLNAEGTGEPREKREEGSRLGVLLCSSLLQPAGCIRITTHCPPLLGSPQRHRPGAETCGNIAIEEKANGTARLESHHSHATWHRVQDAGEMRARDASEPGSSQEREEAITQWIRWPC